MKGDNLLIVWLFSSVKESISYISSYRSFWSENIQKGWVILDSLKWSFWCFSSKNKAEVSLYILNFWVKEIAVSSGNCKNR